VMTTRSVGGDSGGSSRGMIGFDIACKTERSGPRMQGYLVNDLCKTQVPIPSALTSLSLPKRV
jgi:hypothetical protein